MRHRLHFLTITALIALPLASAPSAKKSAPDNYWKIHLEGDFAHHDGHDDFWRTHEVGGMVEVYDICSNSHKPVATAKANPDGSWALNATFGNLAAKVTAPGRLTFTALGKLFAFGQRITPTKCTNHIPDKIKYIIPATGERTFAAIEGPAKALELATAATLPSSRIPTLPSLPALPPTTSVLADGDDYVCTKVPVIETAVRTLSGVPTLGPNAAIYPGSLLQGKSYMTGSFAPITISRAGGAISIEGINVAKTAKDLPLISADFVNASVANLARQKSLGTESNFSFRTDVIYNSDQLAYSLGVDGRFLNGLDNTIHIDPASKKNYVLATFTQTYFTASFEDPETKYAVFADEDQFEDDEGQIAPDNPPLYVKTVGYGRSIYFLVSSEHDASAIENALNSAKDGKPDATTLSRGAQVRYSTILQQSTVSYFIQGGDALATLGHVGQISNVGDMYAAIKKAITDAKVAQLTDFSKGLPVTYSLAYLGTRQPASLGFATTSYRTQCYTKPKDYASFAVNVTCVDDEARITLIGPNGKEEAVWNGGGGIRYIPLSDLLFPKSKDNYTLRLQLRNTAGPSCLHFQLIRFDAKTGAKWGLDNDSGRMVPMPNVSAPGTFSPLVGTGGSWNVGWIVDYRVQLNRSTGAVSVTQGR